MWIRLVSLYGGPLELECDKMLNVPDAVGHLLCERTTDVIIVIVIIVNPRLEVDLFYKSILLEVGLHSHEVPLRIIKTLLLGRF